MIRISLHLAGVIAIYNISKNALFVCERRAVTAGMLLRGEIENAMDPVRSIPINMEV